MISTLRFSRLTVLFLVLETVLACAFICNALAFIGHKAGPMLTPSGIASDQVLLVDKINIPLHFDPKTGRPSGGANPSELKVMEKRVRAIPGVKSVSVDMGMPYTSSFTATSTLRRAKGGPAVTTSDYFGDHLVETLGLDLIKGRKFSPDEVVTIGIGQGGHPPVAIITQALAQQLFPAGRALGQRIFVDNKSEGAGMVIVGVVQHMPARQPTGVVGADNALILPIIPNGLPLVSVLVRTDPRSRTHVASKLPGVIKEALHLKAGSGPRIRTFETIRSAYFGPSRSLIGLMVSVTLAVIAITVIGIMGLTGFWVQKRTRTIGIRRALGATRGNILRYFLAENILVIGSGIALGTVAAYSGNLWLMGFLEIPHLPWQWLPISAAFLCALGQLSALIPARRAAAIPPLTATRKV